MDPEAFVTILEEAYRERDKEIEKKCTENYDVSSPENKATDQK